MNKIIRNAILLGLGAASLTKEKVEKTVKGFVKKGKINTKEGKALVRALLGQAKKEKARVSSLLKTEGKKLVKEAETVTKNEVKILKARIAKLEKKVKKR
ncbi:hypothetical protein KY361_00440 [Candidatus Woesearchaeota archaeon]|nr:hypothetical protein [Candidatus Woesearchaeota archaeon]